MSVKYEGRGREWKINRTERRMTANSSVLPPFRGGLHEQESISSALAVIKTGQIHLNMC